jgi:hypothetical protein
MRLPSVVVVALALVANSGVHVLAMFAGGRQSDAQLERMAKIDRFAWDGPLFLPRDADAPQIRALARVVREKSGTGVVNQVPVRYTTLTFEGGLVVTYRTFGAPAQSQVIDLTISCSRWAVKDGLGVGAPATRVVQTLGAVRRTRDGWLKYSGETEHVDFLINQDRVSKVVFTYYAD